MPEGEKSVVLLNGEKEKKKKNTDLSNKSDDIEFDVIARSRVGNTINSLNQGMSKFISYSQNLQRKVTKYKLFVTVVMPRISLFQIK